MSRLAARLSIFDMPWEFAEYVCEGGWVGGVVPVRGWLIFAVGRPHRQGEHGDEMWVPPLFTERFAFCGTVRVLRGNPSSAEHGGAQPFARWFGGQAARWPVLLF